MPKPSINDRLDCPSDILRLLKVPFCVTHLTYLGSDVYNLFEVTSLE